MSVGYGKTRPAFIHRCPILDKGMYSIQLSDHVDTSQLIERGIKLGYTPDVLNEAGELNFFLVIIPNLYILSTQWLILPSCSR